MFTLLKDSNVTKCPRPFPYLSSSFYVELCTCDQINSGRRLYQVWTDPVRARAGKCGTRSIYQTITIIISQLLRNFIRSLDRNISYVTFPSNKGQIVPPFHSQYKLLYYKTLHKYLWKNLFFQWLTVLTGLLLDISKSKGESVTLSFVCSSFV